MGLSITSMLASVASDLTVSKKLPTSGQPTLFSKFSMFSTFFTFAVVIECVVVIYFAYSTHDDMVPPYIKWAKKKFQKWKEGDIKIASDKNRDSSAAPNRKTSNYAVNFEGEGSEQNSSSEIEDSAGDFKAEKDALNNRKWKNLAIKIDKVCRVLFLTSYIVIIGILLGPHIMKPH